jgi:hypothetical protein
VAQATKYRGTAGIEEVSSEIRWDSTGRVRSLQDVAGAIENVVPTVDPDRFRVYDWFPKCAGPDFAQQQRLGSEIL